MVECWRSTCLMKEEEKEGGKFANGCPWATRWRIVGWPARESSARRSLTRPTQVKFTQDFPPTERERDRQTNTRTPGATWKSLGKWIKKIEEEKNTDLEILPGCCAIRERANDLPPQSDSFSIRGNKQNKCKCQY